MKWCMARIHERLRISSSAKYQYNRITMIDRLYPSITKCIRLCTCLQVIVSTICFLPKSTYELEYRSSVSFACNKGRLIGRGRGEREGVSFRWDHLKNREWHDKDPSVLAQSSEGLSVGLNFAAAHWQYWNPYMSEIFSYGR